MRSRLVRLVVVVGVFGALLVSLAAEAQQGKVYRVGLLLQSVPPAPGTSAPGSQILQKALHDVGYIEGRNIIFDRRYAEGKNERFSSLATELVALKPDAIVADSTPAVIAAMRATAAIPIVMTGVADPVASGLVASFARPGGNVTGVSNFSTAMHVKSVDLLHALVPKATRLAVLMSDNPVHPAQLEAIQDAAKGLGLTVLPSIVRSPEEFEGAFASMTKNNAGALIVLAGAPFGPPPNRDKLVALAAKTKLPTVYLLRWWVDAGGLLSYGPSLLYTWGLAATYVDKILKGAKPADLPVQQPTHFELVINLKTAKALGLTIPQSLLIRADEVIQ